MRAALSYAHVLSLGYLLVACAETASTDPGTRARLQVREGQFVPGSLPQESDGPEILSVQLSHDLVSPTRQAESLSGALSEQATALALGVVGDVGYWIVRAGAASLTEPDLPTFSATLSFAHELSQRSLTLRLLAVDARGNVGSAQTRTLRVARDQADSPLSIQLTWDTNADLDLHVLVPGGEEIFAGNVSSYVAPPPGQPPDDPHAFRDAGVLSLDSNADCVIDGLRTETVSFPGAPPSGQYKVRVATPSLCGESVAHFHVRAFLRGEQIAEAEGISTPQSTRFGGGRGAGAFAFSFRVP